MKEQEWTSGMLIADEQVLEKIKEMEKTMDSARMPSRTTAHCSTVTDG